MTISPSDCVTGCSSSSPWRGTGSCYADEGMWLYQQPAAEAMLKAEVRLRADAESGSSTCGCRACGSTAAARARSSRPTAW